MISGITRVQNYLWMPVEKSVKSVYCKNCNIMGIVLIVFMGWLRLQKTVITSSNSLDLAKLSWLSYLGMWHIICSLSSIGFLFPPMTKYLLGIWVLVTLNDYLVAIILVKVYFTRPRPKRQYPFKQKLYKSKK